MHFPEKGRNNPKVTDFGTIQYVMYYRYVCSVLGPMQVVGLWTGRVHLPDKKY